MPFPFDDYALEKYLLMLQVALLPTGTVQRKLLSDRARPVEEFGSQLFDALLPSQALSLFSVSRDRALQEQLSGVRLRLHIQAPELDALPWEYLYDTSVGEYLCLMKRTPIVRYTKLPLAIQPFMVAPPLRILGMIASPQDQVPLDIPEEKAHMEEVLKDLKASGQVELTWLKGQTWRDLQQEMWHGPWHIFHFIGHGAFDKDSDEGLIALADEQGKTHLLIDEVKDNRTAFHDFVTRIRRSPSALHNLGVAEKLSLGFIPLQPGFTARDFITKREHITKEKLMGILRFVYEQVYGDSFIDDKEDDKKYKSYMERLLKYYGYILPKTIAIRAEGSS